MTIKKDFSSVEAWLHCVVSEETRNWSAAMGACKSVVEPDAVSAVWPHLYPTVHYYIVPSGVDIDACAVRLDTFIKAHQRLAGETP